MANGGFEANTFRRPTQITTQSDEGKNYRELSLKQYLDAELKGEKKVLEDLNQMRLKMDKDRVKQQQEREKEAAYAIADIENGLKKQGLELTNNLRKQLLKDFEKEQRLADNKALVDFYKEKAKAETKAQKEAEKRQKKDLDTYKKIAELRATAGEKKESGDKLGAFKDTVKADAMANGQMLKESLRELGDNMGKNLVRLADNMTNAVNQAISTYTGYQTAINARLQGSTEAINRFSEIEDRLQAVSYSPLIKTQELYDNLSTLVAEGIAQNVEQRAFLQTVKDGIATTFDANNSALKRIIRLQQQDSTAARLGLEAYLTSYMNELTQNTEYLQSTFDSVAESLIEASSLMSMQQSTEFEYVVQKWLGTVTGLGLSEGASQGIATALGQLGSGDVNALAGSQMQNLLVMAASRVGLDYSDLLTNGLNAQNTNRLMYGIFNFLGDISKESNNVVKSQYAQTFGVSVSDLVAAGNLGDTINGLYSNMLTYGDMYNELSSQMNLLNKRMSVNSIIDNLFSNFNFAQGANIGSSVLGATTWKITDLIQQATGGINIPYISVLGSGVDLNATVEGLMKLGIVGISTLGSIGDLVSGVSTAFGDNASNMLNSLGIGANAATNTTLRGTGFNASSRATGGVDTSITTLIGNSSGDDYYQSSLNSANDAQQKKLDEMTPEETASDRIEKNTTTITDILTETKNEIISLRKCLEGMSLKQGSTTDGWS